MTVAADNDYQKAAVKRFAKTFGNMARHRATRHAPVPFHEFAKLSDRICVGLTTLGFLLAWSFFTWSAMGVLELPLARSVTLGCVLGGIFGLLIVSLLVIFDHSDWVEKKCHALSDVLAISWLGIRGKSIVLTIDQAKMVARHASRAKEVNGCFREVIMDWVAKNEAHQPTYREFKVLFEYHQAATRIFKMWHVPDSVCRPGWVRLDPLPRGVDKIASKDEQIQGELARLASHKPHPPVQWNEHKMGLVLRGILAGVWVLASGFVTLWMIAMSSSPPTLGLAASLFLVVILVVALLAAVLSLIFVAFWLTAMEVLATEILDRILCLFRRDRPLSDFQRACMEMGNYSSTLSMSGFPGKSIVNGWASLGQREWKVARKCAERIQRIENYHATLAKAQDHLAQVMAELNKEGMVDHALARSQAQSLSAKTKPSEGLTQVPARRRL